MISQAMLPITRRSLASICTRNIRLASSDSSSKPSTTTTTQQETKDATEKPQKKAKTIAEQDEELRQKMGGLSGDGGESGVEYEDGQPVAMKRSVAKNMFRYI